MYVVTKSLERGILERETRERKFFQADRKGLYDKYIENTLMLLFITLGRVIRTPPNLVW
jgi:hypothetical protein